MINGRMTDKTSIGVTVAITSKRTSKRTITRYTLASIGLSLGCPLSVAFYCANENIAVAANSFFFLVACSDSISHYVCPSVGPSVTHLLFRLIDYAWGPQSLCLGQSSRVWSHWSQFQMNSLRNFKKPKNCQKFKIENSEVLVKECAQNVL